VTGGTYSGAPGAFFLQTVFWPTEVGRNASIGCCEHEPGDADAQGLNELLSEIHDSALAITRRGECRAAAAAGETNHRLRRGHGVARRIPDEG
jgi:hypothetical protein